MWLWILSALFLLAVWGFWLVVPGFPTWLALGLTALVVLLLIGLVVFRRLRARRAARALERAIAQQAQEQVVAARPEDRAEVQELQRRMLEGIRALKSSKLGEGGDPLYSLPWYAIVGPPGAGKTTAIRHSGLSFPYLGANGGAVRGVGGTRNCDWWFTSEAILLDTAGRYTTEADDRDEWISFLRMLRTYRGKMPLNGVLVAVAVSELIDASDEDVQRTADRVRDRIDEMQDELKMVLPVYVVFTKCDLVAGFSEYFGDLKRSERGQAWGATFRLTQDKSLPGALFDAEFDELVSAVHKRTVKRIAAGRASRADKEKIYQFPLELAAIKRNLSEFMATAFKPAPPPATKKAKVVATPILRGFYFSSGTQEGKPLDRVVGAMGRAFGLKPADTAADAAPTEAKSFFLRDVFERIVFPDKDVAGRSEGELRRLRWQRIAVAAGAASFAALLLFPAIFAFSEGRKLIAETKRISDEAAAIDWTSGPVLPKVAQLDTLRAHIGQLDKWREDGPPLAMRWGMYRGDELFAPATEQYIHALKRGFIEPVKEQLERRLKQATGGKFLEEYETLKTYLLLGDDYTRELLTYESWETGRLTKEWAELLRGQAQGLSENDLRNQIQDHVKYYVDLRKRSQIKGLEFAKGEPMNQQVIDATRDVLTRVGPSQRYYDQFVTVLIDEKVDEAGPNTNDNLRYPPVTLTQLFEDRPQVLTVLGSKRKLREGKAREVRGPYTYAGHEAVVASLDDGYQILEREKWVVPLSKEEQQQGDKIKQALVRVREDFDNQYIAEWTEFLRDVDVKIPQNNREAIDEFRVLATQDWPYWRLLKAVRDNTQFDDVAAERSSAPTAAAPGGVLEQIKDRAKKKIDQKLRTPGAGSLLDAIGAGPKRVDPIQEKFKRMVAFGFAKAPKEGEPPPPTGLGGYVQQLEQLAATMQVVEESPAGGDTKKVTELFEGAVMDAEKKVLAMDRFGQDVIRELLLDPLRQSYRAVLKSAGGAASGLWEVEVWPQYRDHVQNRYPFNMASRRDASFEDVLKFFRPKEGTLWGFYEANLKDYHNRVGHKFIPATHLAGVAPARRFTPFNANLYNCLERADEITDALFPKGAEPRLEFSVNLTTVSPIVSEIVFELDGKKRSYRNEKEFWHAFTWPGEAEPSASIRIRGAGGLDEEIKREGQWGLWRLLEAGRHTATKDDDKLFRVEWQMSAPPVVVVMEIRPKRANHPFPLGFFRDTNCPSSIGDTFGG
ncbi:MAG: type VI secretion system membrane subunit TssM [Myxococcales bacterium]|nr:type VI secretion system membrane subunit TssM [Myxococcales bacterium]